MQKFFEKALKKVVQKFRQKFGPPVSEVLDPLVDEAQEEISWSRCSPIVRREEITTPKTRRAVTRSAPGIRGSAG